MTDSLTDDRMEKIGAALRDMTQAIVRAMPAFTAAARQAGEAMGRFAAAMRAAFPARPVERRIDRARRQRIATMMRRRARRARRHGRVLA